MTDRLGSRGMGDKAIRLALDPHPVRTLTLKMLKRWGLGSYEFRVAIGAVDRPHYGYSVWQAASLAKQLDQPRISVIEFGVGRGNGLVSLENHAIAASAALGVEIEVYGFDTGKGLPAPADYRDLPYHFQAGYFEMDEAALRRRLTSATLVLGDVRETLPSFVEVHRPAPIAAVMQDLDYYSSTASALTLFDVDHVYRLPRIYTYFDDIVGHEIALYNQYTGERLAIAEFNDSHQSMKIAPVSHLQSPVIEPWHCQMFVVHDFAHPQYDRFVGEDRPSRAV